MYKIDKGTIASELIIEAAEMKGKRPTQLNFEELVDVAESLVKKLLIPRVSNWVAVKDSMPENSDQVFVKYENGKYGINEWWESDDCWKYQFDNMIVKEWCKPPCY